MVDDGFRVCLDRTVTTSACFEPFNPVKDTNLEVPTNAIATNPGEGNGNGNGGEGSSSSSLKVRLREMVECRICQEEDDVHAMEAPCSCSGTLKFAHRRCIQKWCNKKGNITCEICNKVFSPNYTLPPSCSNPEVLAIDIRQAWGEHIDLHDSHLLVLAATERQFLEF